MGNLHRRDFIRATLFGGIAMSAFPTQAIKLLSQPTEAVVDTTSKVGLVTGTNRADMAFRALQPFAKEIAQAAGNKRIIVKPNMVSSSIQLSATHRDTIEGVLEFFKSINKLENVVVAESVADGPTIGAYDNFGYIPVAKKYNVKLMDIDESPSQLLYAMDELDLRPKPMRMSSMLIDRNNFVFSVARMKTHDRVTATLSLKNVVVGAPVKDPGFSWGKDRKAGAKNDKPIIHGNGFRGINYNLFNTAFYVRPDLALIDGFDGMQGDGPTQGTLVDHKVCVAGLDWLAVDRVGLELMGIDPAKVGYLTYCSEAGMGEYDIRKIEIIGEKIADHIKPYELSRNWEKQLEWMIPLRDKAERLY